MVHDLIEAYDILKLCTVVRSAPATRADMKEFHSELYLDHLKTFTEVDDDYMTNAQDEECGIGMVNKGILLLSEYRFCLWKISSHDQCSIHDNSTTLYRSSCVVPNTFIYY